MSTRYRVCFSRVALLLLGFAVAAAAQDELCETVWIVSPDGTLLGWPDPTVEDAPNDPTHKPFVVFDTSPSACTDCMCPWAMALLLVPGPSDLASLCDPERHLKKTNRLPFDEMLLLGYVPKELAKSGTDRARRRGFLDALMSWRVLGSRGLKEGASMLEGMSEAKELDPIMRLAAADVAAMLEGRKLPAVDLPPLDGLPTDADVLVVIDQRRLPPWRDVWRLHRVWTVREMRQVIARVGAAVTSADLCDAQWFMDRESEGYYELARRFGNARAHRSVLALRFPEGSTALSAAKYLLCCDGLFETENFRLGCGACGVKPRDGPEGAVAAQFGDLDVTVAPERLVVSRGFAVPPAGAGIPADLAKLGLGGDDAIWVHCRAVPFGELLPFTGLEALTVRVGFDGGVTLRAEGRFETGEAARQAKIVIEQLKTVRLEAVALREVPVDAVSPLQRFLASVTVTVDGSTVTAQWTGPGATPESLLAGVVDLAALYAQEED